MECRAGCGACCIAPSISSPLPGMPQGKAAGEVCVNLDPQSYRCRIWHAPNYPEVCRRFRAAEETCGGSRGEALQLLDLLEQETRADTVSD
ncbi:MAG: YkgJ family cysteine cluster protein [Halieaceae bacterium]|jgi:Fe-S-cluster containining protein|nr:YkgJ family cysteine cluster protein [Halieaceae bacterium]